jgi:phenylpropionate dioxygenase-like ring-hydroxylating dioxygenase large terminal subunit
MLTREENMFMAQVGPGTPMGDLMRRFWHPVLLSEELPEPDCPPKRTRILGEDLIAFRDTNGDVGLVDNYCPHRRASLFFGRNEECGLRCVYHGWKFDINGDCVDMPSEPAESNFKDKVKITAYPTNEGGGMIWAYMGPAELKPGMPQLEYLDVPDAQRVTTKVMYESNFVQVIEGEIDTVHASLLHSSLDSLSKSESATTVGGRYSYKDRPPRFFVEDTESGILIGARRDAEDDSYYWRISRWLYPYITMIPREPQGSARSGLIVPIDDENCWFFWVRWNPFGPLSDDEIRFFKTMQASLAPVTYLGQANKRNDYMIDREMQRTVNYTGIPQNNARAQDAAMTDSMGAISDRDNEHLGTTDMAIIRMRRRLIQAAQALQEGTEPYAASHPEVYRVRSGGAVLPRDVYFTEDASVQEDITVK